VDPLTETPAPPAGDQGSRGVIVSSESVTIGVVTPGKFTPLPTTSRIELGPLPGNIAF
jgi:hypothetical protein